MGRVFTKKQDSAEFDFQKMLNQVKYQFSNHITKLLAD